MYLRIYTFVDVYKMYTVIGCYMCVCVAKSGYVTHSEGLRMKKSL